MNNGWLPITKPVHGEMVQLLAADGTVKAGRWYESSFCDSSNCWAVDGNSLPKHQFTHWQPLAKPPVIPKKPDVFWLDPEEVLPREEERVLFVTDGTSIMVGYWSSEYFRVPSAYYLPCNVRRWSPAPEVPKEEK